MKITDSQRIDRLERQLAALITLVKMKGYNKPEPQLKQIDQSVFNGLDEKWRFAAVDGSKGFPVVYEHEPYILELERYYTNRNGLYRDLEQMKGYDTTNWKNSLIERESVELTGSDLARAMLERGDKYVMCLVFDDTRNLDVTYVIRGYHDGYFHTKLNSWENAIPINNQGEPLTQAEAGL